MAKSTTHRRLPIPKCLARGASDEAEREPRGRIRADARPTGTRTHAHSTDEGGDNDMAKKVAKKPAKKAGKKR
jgi:hypothetical protein